MTGTSQLRAELVCSKPNLQLPNSRRAGAIWRMSTADCQCCECQQFLWAWWGLVFAASSEHMPCWQGLAGSGRLLQSPMLSSCCPGGCAELPLSLGSRQPARLSSSLGGHISHPSTVAGCCCAHCPCPIPPSLLQVLPHHLSLLISILQAGWMGLCLVFLTNSWLLFVNHLDAGVESTLSRVAGCHGAMDRCSAGLPGLASVGDVA